MSDLFWILVTIGAFGLLIAWLDWTSPTPPSWVVKFRMWRNKNMKQTQVGMILMAILIVATVICAILAFTVPALQPMAGHIA